MAKNYENAGFESLKTALSRYLEGEYGYEQPTRTMLAIAAPVWWCLFRRWDRPSLLRRIPTFVITDLQPAFAGLRALLDSR